MKLSTKIRCLKCSRAFARTRPSLAPARVARTKAHRPHSTVSSRSTLAAATTAAACPLIALVLQGHAYSVLNAREIPLTGGVFRGKDKIKLVQCRNPWGSYEWDGAWSDKDKNWQKYKNVAKKLKHDGEGEDDGIFWMP